MKEGGGGLAFISASVKPNHLHVSVISNTMVSRDTTSFHKYYHFTPLTLAFRFVMVEKFTSP